MIFRNKNIYILCVFLILILSSCQRRYWYRDFVWSSAKNDELANIKIVNETPQVLDAEFEKEILKACSKQLLKKGFRVIEKKVPFVFTLTIKVESYSVSGLAHYGGLTTILYPYYNKDVKAIVFDCNMSQSKKDLVWKVWENNNDLYYFSKPKRDLRRSISMVKYLIRSAKQK